MDAMSDNWNGLDEKAAEEHILVCLSSAPSNAKIVQTAAKMARAFGGIFTALYVKTPDAEHMSDADAKRLQYHIQLAEKLGATVITIYGDDVSFQIAEFARLSNVTKIVLGRSNVTRRHIWSKPMLIDKLTVMALDVDIYIIPDYGVEKQYHTKKSDFSHRMRVSLWDLFKTFLILAAATAIGSGFYAFHFTEANIITIYILGVLLTSLFTRSHLCSVISSLASVLVFNFFFTEPRLTFHAYDSGYPFTFIIMLIASLITGTLAAKLKSHASQSAQAAFRTRVLLDTNQLLQKAKDEQELLTVTASQLMKLLGRDIIIYPETEGKISKGYLYRIAPESDENDTLLFEEKEVAEWVFHNRKRAGATTRMYQNAACLYLAIRINHKVYGVVGIHTEGKPLDAFENNMMLSVLGECALAVDNKRNAKEKEKAAVLAKNEQLRANLLRTISHDLRTPLTSISGNAGNLISHYEKMDEPERMQAFTDIYDDSMWLIGLVENLLSVTRIEEGRMNFHMTSELVDEVVTEALRHVNRKSGEHHIEVDIRDDLMMAKMDTKLIIQVIINLVDNAVKYTPVGSQIVISAEREGNMVAIRVADDGPGISKDGKEHVFEMFYTGEKKVADSHRSLGLGLSLCKSIVNAHGGTISVSDNIPHGCVFCFTLPLGEVEIHE